MPLDGDEVRACWQAPRAAEPWEGLFSELPRPSAPDTERVGDGAGLVPRPLSSAAGSGIAADSALPGASRRGFETDVEAATEGPSVRAVDARSTPAADARAGSAKDARAGSAAERAGVIPIESRRPAVAFAVTPASGPAPGRLVEAPLVRPAGRIATTAELRARANLRADVEALLEGQRNVGPREGPVS